MGIIQSIIQSIIETKEMKQPEKKEMKQAEKIEEIEGRKEEEEEEGLYYVPNRYYCGNPAPPPIDYSDAISIVVDGPRLKLYDESTYNYLLEFVLMSRRFCYLQFFGHGGNGKTVKSYTGKELQSIDAFRHSATTALNQYNNLIKKQQFKLEKLLKVNSVDQDGRPLLYMTFTAIDMDTGSSAKYYAAILEIREHHLLGLLTLPSPYEYKRQNLAVLSLSGAGDEDLVVKKKIPVSNVLPCMDQYFVRN